jgi:hypothetical protein
MLAARIGSPLRDENLPVESLYTDWCAHSFTARRCRHIILTNTYSFLSVVMAARGITSEDAFIRSAGEAIRDYLVQSGRSSAFDRFMAAETTEARFSRIPDRRVLGTINELVFLAADYLAAENVSLFKISEYLNTVPLSALWNRGDTSSPGPTFDRMPPRPVSV